MKLVKSEFTKTFKVAALKVSNKIINEVLAGVKE